MIQILRSASKALQLKGGIKKTKVIFRLRFTVMMELVRSLKRKERKNKRNREKSQSNRAVRD